MKKKGIAVVLTIATLTSTLLGGCGVAKESTSTSDMSVVDYDSGSTMYDNAVATSEEEMTPDFNTEEYNAEKETGFAQTSVTPLSTFSADVDTASYSNLRRMIEDGYSLEEIPEGAVRIEEILNYFDYDYNLPEVEEPLGVTTEMSECPLCGGSYEEVQECEICGEPLDNDERKFCRSCKNDITDKIKCFFETFNSLEKKFISELQEDGELDVLMGMGGEK